MAASIFFFLAFEQAGGSLSIFAKDFTQRVLEGNAATTFKWIDAILTIFPIVVVTYVLFTLAKKIFKEYPLTIIFTLVSFISIAILGLWKIQREFTALETEVTVSWFQILNAFFIVMFASAFSKLWEKYWNPSGPIKFAMGLFLVGFSFVVVAYGAMDIPQGAVAGAVRVSMIWLVLADADVKKAAVEAKEAEQQELLDQAIYDRDTSERAYEELMAASEEVANMIRRSNMSYSGAPAGSGGMIWPLSGPVTSEFGWRTHPIFGTARFHSGLDIGGDYGLPIYAAASGTVIHAGWISGYGNTVIIDHGGGVTTLYGHNDSLNVGVGQTVSQGQVIAMCGSTGNSTGPHCHFEVRENGEPVSPYGYL